MQRDLARVRRTRPAFHNRSTTTPSCLCNPLQCRLRLPASFPGLALYFLMSSTGLLSCELCRKVNRLVYANNRSSVIAVVGSAITKAEPNHRPFSLVDPSISFPFVENTISTVVLFVVSIIAPAIIIMVLSLVFVPGPSGQMLSLSSQSMKRKLWEWNAAWMGLALGLAITALFTNGLKLLMGKPRPDLLSRCNPNLLDVSSHLAGGFNDQVGEGTLVSWTICQQRDAAVMADGFQSFPSGHASCKLRKTTDARPR